MRKVPVPGRKIIIPGKIVHYADSVHGPLSHQAAVVIRVFNPHERNKPGTVNLSLFAPGGGSMTLYSVLPDHHAGKIDGTMPTPGTWHWPEDACEEECQ